MPSPSDYDSDLALAHRLADTASTIALPLFHQRHLSVRVKSDGSPVTEADRRVEAGLRAELRNRRPADALVGEELGASGFGCRSWYIDPIDGTAAFASGRPDWRTLIATADGGRVVVGVIDAPALHRRWWASDQTGSWTRSAGDSTATPLAVTGTSRIDHAKVAVWPPIARLPETLHQPATRLLTDTTRAPDAAAAYGCHHGALLVAAGELDAFLFVGGGPWDIAAFVPLVEEAGGRFTDATGGRALHDRTALFSNGRLHGQILDYLRI